MDQTPFGTTGATVSVVGLGGGGPSRLGTATGGDLASAEIITRAALDAGVTLIDTAAVYGTEPAIGAAVAAHGRAGVYVCTKVELNWDDPDYEAQVEASFERSLRNLQLECIDLYQCHGVSLAQYPIYRERIVPLMLRWRDQGKLRHLGITEAFERDHEHAMLHQALDDAVWDCVMVGYNILNPSAARSILPRCTQQGVATLGMFAVRRALSRPERLREVIAGLIAAGELAADAIDPENPLGFLCDPSVADSVTAAAYRFCRHTPGIDVVLTGTGNQQHLEQNIAALHGPPLPAATLARLEQLFGNVTSVTGG